MCISYKYATDDKNADFRPRSITVEPPGKTNFVARCFDDILGVRVKTDDSETIALVKALRKNIDFSTEIGTKGQLILLEMMINREANTFRSNLYSKPTDTVVTMSFQGIAPSRYKKKVVDGMVHPLSQATSD